MGGVGIRGVFLVRHLCHRLCRDAALRIGGPGQTGARTCGPPDSANQQARRLTHLSYIHEPFSRNQQTPKYRVEPILWFLVAIAPCCTVILITAVTRRMSDARTPSAPTVTQSAARLHVCYQLAVLQKRRRPLALPEFPS
jgi:hypothetical protein